MTQAPQQAPAGWYPSPDGAPVQRWWDGTMWTNATVPDEPAPPPEPEPQGPPTSGWPAPVAPRLGPLAISTQVFVALAGVGMPLAWGARAWRGAEPPEWLTEDVALALTGAASGLLLVAGLFWMLWQYRVARSFPPGTTRRSPGWHAGSWLVPVALWWLPYGNVADLFRLTTGRRPGWLPVWWGLWLTGGLVVGLGGVLSVSSPVMGPSVAAVGSLALTAAAPLAWRVVGQLTRQSGGKREQDPS